MKVLNVYFLKNSFIKHLQETANKMSLKVIKKKSKSMLKFLLLIKNLIIFLSSATT